MLFLSLALMLVIVALGLTHRLLLEQEGRSIHSVSLEDSRVHHPPRIDDLQTSGRVTVLKGSEVYDVFRAQFPINPHISSQTNLIELVPDRTYLITSEREVFDRLKDELEDVRTYQSKNRTFNGVRVPHNFVLETERSKEDILGQPLGMVEWARGHGPEEYLYLADVDASNVLGRTESGTVGANVILNQPELLRDRAFVEKLTEGPGKIYLLGRNALRAKPDRQLRSDQLILEQNPGEHPWYDGQIVPPGEDFFAVALPLLVAGVGFLGLSVQGYPLRWALWLLIGILGYALAGEWHLFLAGLATAGAVRFGLRARGPSTAWLVLAGMIAFGYAYQPYVLDAFLGGGIFWFGAVLGLLCVTPDWQRVLGRTVRYGDLVVLGLSAGPFFVAVRVTEHADSIGGLVAYSVLLPLAPILLQGENGNFTFPWLGGIAAWVWVFSAGTAVEFFYWFLLVGLAWFLYRSIGRRGFLWGHGFRT